MTSVDTYTYTRCIKHDKKGKSSATRDPTVWTQQPQQSVQQHVPSLRCGQHHRLVRRGKWFSSFTIRARLCQTEYVCMYVCASVCCCCFFFNARRTGNLSSIRSFKGQKGEQKHNYPAIRPNAVWFWKCIGTNNRSSNQFHPNAFLFTWMNATKMRH